MKNIIYYFLILNFLTDKYKNNWRANMEHY